MKENAIFFSLCWTKGERNRVVQGIKNNRRPYNAIRGGNGSFVLKGTVPELNLAVQTSNKRYIENNIYKEVLQATGHSRMSGQLYNEIKKICEDMTFIVSDNNIDISELSKSLRKKNL